MRHLSVLLAILAAAALAAPAEAVVGGRPATESYPHMTAVYLDGGYVCGASLIAPQWVLTAAHCVVDNRDRAMRPTRFGLDIGATRTGSAASIAPAPATAVTPAELRVHPDFDGREYDVALFRLAAPSSRAAPIALAHPEFDRAAWAPGDLVRLIGFGSRAPDQGTATAGGPLHEVDLAVSSDADCAEAYPDDSDETIVCAESPDEEARDACQGDSGGPLMATRPGGERVLVAVVSRGGGLGPAGDACGFTGQPGAYARVGDGVLASWVRGIVPQPAPPGTGSPAGGSPPGGNPPASQPRRTSRPAVRLRTKRLLLRRDGRVAVRVACASAPCRGSVTLTRGGRRAGRTTYRAAAGRTVTVRIRVARGARSARRLGVRVTAARGRAVSRTLPVRR